MRQAPAHLLKIIEPVVEGLGYECVGIEYNPHPKNGLLRIYIDHENGILLEDCTKVSHQLSGVLDVEDPIQGNYQLEVSSPGADRPFFKLSQFEQFTGEKVMVTLFQPINKRRKIMGVITGVEGDNVLLDEAGEALEIPIKTMSKARLVPDFSKDKGVQGGK